MQLSLNLFEFLLASSYQDDSFWLGFDNRRYDALQFKHIVSTRRFDIQIHIAMTYKPSYTVTGPSDYDNFAIER